MINFSFSWVSFPSFRRSPSGRFLGHPEGLPHGLPSGRAPRGLPTGCPLGVPRGVSPTGLPCGPAPKGLPQSSNLSWGEGRVSCPGWGVPTGLLCEPDRAGLLHSRVPLEGGPSEALLRVTLRRLRGIRFFPSNDSHRVFESPPRCPTRASL